PFHVSHRPYPKPKNALLVLGYARHPPWGCYFCCSTCCYCWCSICYRCCYHAIAVAEHAIAGARHAIAGAQHAIAGAQLLLSLLLRMLLLLLNSSLRKNNPSRPRSHAVPQFPQPCREPRHENRQKQAYFTPARACTRNR
ncbi:unnamed protein product, partial [Ectocarpus sp. 8 AP-2014]